MKIPALLFLTVLLTASSIRSARADGDITGTPPNAAFGFAVTASANNAWERKKGESHSRYKFAPGYGGGIVFEKMFNNTVGLQSGIWVNRIGIDITMTQPVNPLNITPNSLVSSLLAMKFKVDSWSIAVPLTLVTSINASFFRSTYSPG